MENTMFPNRPLTIAKKLPRNNSKKEMYDIYRESYKVLLKV